MKIDLKIIVNAFEATTDSFDQFLNIKTGEIIFLPGVGYMGLKDEYEEDFEMVNSSEDYVKLPEQYELGEYNIMEEFIDSIQLKNYKEKLYCCIHKSHPFRNFKIEATKLGIIDDYYGFKRKKLEQKAIKWCKNNNIEYSIS